MTKAEAAAYLETIDDDEPVFVLRAHDSAMAHTIRRWADMTDAASSPESASREKTARARKLAREVDAWQDQNGSKVAD